MGILNLSNFKKYHRILSLFYNKTNPYSEVTKLSFKDNVAFFQNNNLLAKMKFDSQELLNDEDVYVNLDQLLKLSENFDSLEKQNNTFFHGKDKFKLPKVDVVFDEFDMSYEEEDINLVSFINKNMQIIKEAYNFMTYEKGNSLNAIFINDNKVSSSDNGRIFYQQIIESTGKDFYLNHELLKIIFLLDEEDSIRLYNRKESIYDNYNEVDCEKNHLILSINNELEIFIPGEYHLQAPPVDDKDFISNYSIDNYISLNLKDLYSNINFIKDFTLTETNNVIKFDVKENILKIFAENSLIIEKTLDIKENTIGDIVFYLSSLVVKKILLYFDKEDIYIRANEDVNIVTFTQNEDKIICVSKYN